MPMQIVKRDQAEIVLPSEPPVVQCAGAIVALGGLIVLVRPKPLPDGTTEDLWLLPKGHVEAGESSLEAAAREATEETGVVATFTDAAPFLSTESEKLDLDGKVTEIQHIDWTGGRGSHLDSMKQIDIRHIGLFPPIAALARLSYPDHRRVLATWLTQQEV